MVHILLLILKILGILLLVVLGLVLVLLLCAVFVPVRYEARGRYRDGYALCAGVSWLLHILSLKAEYGTDLDEFSIRLRVFGVTVWKSDRDKPEEASADTVKEHAADAAEGILKTKERPEERAGREEAKKEVTGKEAAEEEASEEETSEEALYRQLEEDEARFRAQVEAQEREKKSIGNAVKERAKKAVRKRGKRKEEPEEETEEAKKEAKKVSGFRPGAFVRGIMEGIKNFFQKLKFSFQAFCDKLKSTRDFAADKKAWLEDEKNQASIRLLVKQAKKLIAHMWPLKGRGRIVFGFDDPYTTGQILSAASLIYPFYYRQLTLEPVFDQKVFEAEGSFKGRIRVWNLLWLLFGIYRDRHTWRLIRSFMK